MPEPISDQVAAQDAVATPVSAPAPTPTPTPAATPAPVSTTSTPIAAAATPSTPVQPSWLSSLREKGIDLGSDEAGALGKLAELHTNYSKLAPIAPYAQQYVQHAAEFSKFLAERQKAAAPAPGPDAPFYSKYWQPPEFNPAWERMLDVDANGNIVAKAGTPPDVLPKYLAHQQFRKEQAEKFLSNPHEYLKETISHLAREEAQKIVQAQFGQVDTRRSVNDFMQQNESWLFDRDASGQAVTQSQFNPHTGQYEQKPKLSQWGSAFANYVREESEYQAASGMPQDINRQRDVAMAKIQRDVAIWKLNNQGNGAATGTPTAQAPPVDPQQAANQRFLQQNNPAAGIPAAAGNSTPAPAAGKRNLADMLRENFKRKGITDEVLINSN